MNLRKIAITVILLGSTVGTAWGQLCAIGNGTLPDGTSEPSTIGSDGSQFVLVMEDDMLYTSPDGDDWTPRFIDGGLRGAYDVSWTGREFIVMRGRPVLVSQDGISWVEETPNEDFNALRADWDGSRTVIVGSGGSGTMSARPDGGDWAPVDYGSLARLSVVLWVGDQFIAGGEAGLILTSPDGITWTERDTPTGVSIGNMATDGDLIIAIAGGTVLLSTDGIMWTEGVSPGISGIGDFIWDGQQFIAGGIDFGADEAAVSVTQDGITWRSTLVGVAESNIEEIATNGQRTFAVTQRRFQVGPPNQFVELATCPVIFADGFE